MTDPVAQQYETFPYPDRDPADEKTRLIVGSPSDPVEIDHFLYRGRRDWSKPFRALVAGGGTGDGLVQLAAKLDVAGCPVEITYIDLSTAARNIAEARIAVRGLENVSFHTGDIRDAPAHGPFDYIDCTGVLHHLENPQAGFDALAAALKPDGGLGLMVYAPYGRTGVYDLQNAFADLLSKDDPQTRLTLAREIVGSLPPGNRFLGKSNLSDHHASDAGFYDLLLHSRDRPYTVGQLADSLSHAGLELISFVEPGKYDLLRLLPKSEPLRERAQALSPVAAMASAEKLRGNIKTHIAYARRAGTVQNCVADASDPLAVPRLKGVAARDLARQLAKSGKIRISLDGAEVVVEIQRAAAPVVALANGQANLAAMAKRLGTDWLAFSSLWAPASRELSAFGILRYSRTFS